LITLRKGHEAFAGGELEIIPTENDHVLGLMRKHADKRAVIFANFSEYSQTIPARILEGYSTQDKKKLHGISQASLLTEMVLESLDFLVFGN